MAVAGESDELLQLDQSHLSQVNPHGNVIVMF